MTAISIISEKSFKVKMSAKKWKALFRTFKALQPKMRKTKKGDNDLDLPVEVTSERIRIKSMDASHIILLDVKLARDDCLSYSCARDATFVTGLHKLLKVLETMDNSEIVTLELAKGAVELHSVYPLDDSKTLRKTYKIKTDEGESRTPLPRIDLNAKFTIHAQTLRNILRSMASAGQYYLTIEAKTGELIFTNSQTTVSLPDWDVEIKEPSKASYSIDLLRQFLAAISADIITLEFSTKMPLKITCPNVDYYIAPRIADDEVIAEVNRA